MKSWFVALVGLALSSAAFAHSYRIVLSPPATGKLLIGHAGVQAVDEITPTAKVRIVAPGNEVQQRGTVRVLVMNLSAKAFEFGPDQVTLRLGDGTELKPVPVDTMEKGRELVERESRYAASTEFRNSNEFASLSQQAGSGMTTQSAAPVSASGGGSAFASAVAQEQGRQRDERLTPGWETLNAIYQILIPLTVEPKHAWGGYYVFDVPKAVWARKADQPLTILVRTAGEEHRFAATLRWR